MDNEVLLSFRGLGAGGEKPFRAFLARLDPRDLSVTGCEDLTTFFSDFVEYPVADPKLFAIDGEPWLTFNTGHFERPNSIYVAPLSPAVGKPLRVQVPVRTEIEKNWGFFSDEGLLAAIYSLDPLVILRESGRDSSEVHLEPVTGDLPEKSPKSPPLTIGTQPTLVPGASGCLALIAHRRRYIRRKRVYTGRPVLVDLNARKISMGNRPWLHSLKSLMGNKVRHNPNLLSCSYFSGLTLQGSDAIVAYGINDVDFGMAEVPISAWTGRRQTT